MGKRFKGVRRALRHMVSACGCLQDRSTDTAEPDVTSGDQTVRFNQEADSKFRNSASIITNRHARSEEKTVTEESYQDDENQIESEADAARGIVTISGSGTEATIEASVGTGSDHVRASVETGRPIETENETKNITPDDFRKVQARIDLENVMCRQEVTKSKGVENEARNVTSRDSHTGVDEISKAVVVTPETVTKNNGMENEERNVISQDSHTTVSEMSENTKMSSEAASKGEDTGSCANSNTIDDLMMTPGDRDKTDTSNGANISETHTNMDDDRMKSSADSEKMTSETKDESISEKLLPNQREVAGVWKTDNNDSQSGHEIVPSTGSSYQTPSEASSSSKSGLLYNDRRDRYGRRLSQSVLPEVNYEILKVVRGHYSQSDIDPQFVYIGSQCTSNCLEAIHQAGLGEISSWNANNLDIILSYGNILHATLRDVHRLSTNSDNRIGILDLPSTLCVSLGEDILHFQKCGDLLYGQIKGQADPEFGVVGLHAAIQSLIFDKRLCSSGILTVGEYSFAVMRDNRDFLWLFDSHMRGIDGLVDSGGTSVLLQFEHIEDLVRHMAMLLNNGDIMYELQGITASVVSC